MHATPSPHKRWGGITIFVPELTYAACALSGFSHITSPQCNTRRPPWLGAVCFNTSFQKHTLAHTGCTVYPVVGKGLGGEYCGSSSDLATFSHRHLACQSYGAAPLSAFLVSLFPSPPPNRKSELYMNHLFWHFLFKINLSLQVVVGAGVLARELVGESCNTTRE